MKLWSDRIRDYVEIPDSQILSPGVVWGVKQELRDKTSADKWTEAKRKGSSHYKTGSCEPVDLYRSAKPHESYNAFDIKALTDVIKYAFRLLTRGYLAGDVDKIIHYMELYRADMEGR